MPPTNQTQEEAQTETQAALDAGVMLAEAKDRMIDVSGIPVALLPDGMKVHLLIDALTAADLRADAPRRLKGTATHHEVKSFIDHVNRFKDADSTIWADTGNVRLTAVLNYHRGTLPQPGDLPPMAGSPRWSDHRAVYACPLSAEWRLWMAHNEKWMSQETFGQFIEDNMKDLANPDPANPADAEMPEPARGAAALPGRQQRGEVLLRALPAADHPAGRLRRGAQARRCGDEAARVRR